MTATTSGFPATFQIALMAPASTAASAASDSLRQTV